MTREEEIREKAKSLYYHFCVRDTCEGKDDDCTNCPYGKVIEPLVTMAKWADKNPRKGLWDAEKVCNFIYNHAHVRQFGDIVIDDMSVTEFVELIKKAMETES